jgi:hypothetical protein
MSKRINLLQIWKKKDKIFEGISHSIFKRDDIEAVARERLQICRSNTCGFHDPNGTSEAAVIKGAESCASCGCKLAWKTRALSDECPVGKWKALLNEIEEAMLKNSLGIADES